MRGEIIEFFIIKQIKKPRLVLCSVVKHLGSGIEEHSRSGEKHSTAASRVFPRTSFVLYRFCCFTTAALQQNTSSFVNYFLSNTPSEGFKCVLRESLLRF